MTRSFVETFSIPPDRVQDVDELKKMVRARGESFSSFVVGLLLEALKNEKNEEPLADPLNLPRQRVTQSDIDMQFDILNLSQQEINRIFDDLEQHEDGKTIRTLRDKGFQCWTVAKKKICVLNKVRLN